MRLLGANIGWSHHFTDVSFNCDISLFCFFGGGGGNEEERRFWFAILISGSIQQGILAYSLIWTYKQAFWVIDNSTTIVAWTHQGHQKKAVVCSQLPMTKSKRTHTHIQINLILICNLSVCWSVYVPKLLPHSWTTWDWTLCGIQEQPRKFLSHEFASWNGSGSFRLFATVGHFVVNCISHVPNDGMQIALITNDIII